MKIIIKYIFFSLIFISCGNNLKDNIIGKWIAVGYDAVNPKDSIEARAHLYYKPTFREFKKDSARLQENGKFYYCAISEADSMIVTINKKMKILKLNSSELFLSEQSLVPVIVRMRKMK